MNDSIVNELNIYAKKSWTACSTPRKLSEPDLRRKHEALLYRMARHLRNTDEMTPLEWGRLGCDLLAELRELDSEKYDREVKR